MDNSKRQSKPHFVDGRGYSDFGGDHDGKKKAMPHLSAKTKNGKICGESMENKEYRL